MRIYMRVNRTTPATLLRAQAAAAFARDQTNINRRAKKRLKMPKHSDMSALAERVKADQAMRLRILREMLGLDLQTAAEMANVSRYSWHRMEWGTARIDTIALYNFCSAVAVSADYVISGEFRGLPRSLWDDIRRRETVETVVLLQDALTRNEDFPPIALRRKSRRKSTPSSGRSPAEPENPGRKRGL